MPKQVIYSNDGKKTDSVAVLQWNDDYVQLGVADSKKVETHKKKDSRFTDLNREQIDSLIKLLRRARNRVYGGDK